VEGADPWQATVGRTSHCRSSQNQRTREYEAQNSHLTASRSTALIGRYRWRCSYPRAVSSVLRRKQKMVSSRSGLFRRSFWNETKRKVIRSSELGSGPSSGPSGASPLSRRDPVCDFREAEAVGRLFKLYLLKTGIDPEDDAPVDPRNRVTVCELSRCDCDGMAPMACKNSAHQGSAQGVPARSPAASAARPRKAAATPMVQQQPNDYGASSAPQRLVRLVGCSDPHARSDGAAFAKQKAARSRRRREIAITE
jgi:hypothetical protein